MRQSTYHTAENLPFTSQTEVKGDTQALPGVFSKQVAKIYNFLIKFYRILSRANWVA